jgi:hypothetical protein
MLVYGKTRVRANTWLPLPDSLPDVNYNLDESQPLVIAVDFSRSLPSGRPVLRRMPPEQATAYPSPGPKHHSEIEPQVHSGK